MSELSPYVIGIDLGTTNCALAYSGGNSPGIKILRIPQLTAPGAVEAKEMLPSFHYRITPREFPLGSLLLPWQSEEPASAVGLFAREHGSRIPTRLVQSAKSWLCCSSVNRREKILPFEGGASQDKITPVEAIASYLCHLRDAWNAQIAKGNSALEFNQQEIVVTVPASFSEVARALTVEAAKLAGIDRLTLLEEPQAAFYDWIMARDKQLEVGQTILVVDIGGGTTDFSLIQVEQDKEKTHTFRRVAVGEHLLLGGDNMDAAIAHLIEKQIKNGADVELTLQQWLQLKHSARLAKERLLNDRACETVPLFVEGVGSQLVGGGHRAEISRCEVESLLLQGFFGTHPSFEAAAQIQRASGIRTIGLPYETEPSIIKHLAAFLRRSQSRSPDFVLFNGGATKPLLFQQTILDHLTLWFEGKRPAILASSSLDLAVARGAAYFACARRGLGIKIGGGTSRSYYVGVEVKNEEGAIQKAVLTLLPRGSEEGVQYEAENRFLAIPNAPVSFQLYSSHKRLQDRSGDLISYDPEELLPLPPLYTVLRYGKKNTDEKIPVRLGIALTHVGTLELWLKSEISDHRWALEFQIRSQEGDDNQFSSQQHERIDEQIDPRELDEAKSLIAHAFENAEAHPEQLMAELEKTLERPRLLWPLSLLRSLVDRALDYAPQKLPSREHELRWWNLIGFLLRPGCGYPLDDHRLSKLWKIILSDKTARPLDVQMQRWICYRRIAAGLKKGQQMQLANEMMNSIFDARGGLLIKNQNEYELSEKIRALAAMESLDPSLKIKLGNALLKVILAGSGRPYHYWSLARLGARQLLYGPLTAVVSPDVCMQWLNELATHSPSLDREQLGFVVGHLARQTGQRELDLPLKELQRLETTFPEIPFLDTPLPFTQEQQNQMLGDNLPSGLLLEISV